ncbi:MAG: TIGR00266 family protein, partial [Pedosphaera sp.]|nr:TIGR00266 family protein [Pedosphaera sp.]
EQTLAEGERFVLDNRNIVSFSQGMAFESVVLTRSVKDSFFSGEGFVVRFTGPGKVIYQTRARPSAGLIRGLIQSIT